MIRQVKAIEQQRKKYCNEKKKNREQTFEHGGMDLYKPRNFIYGVKSGV